MNEIIINDKPLSVKEYKGNRVVTFKEIDAVHGRKDGTARKRFNDNKKRFIEGVDFFKVKYSEVCPQNGQTAPNGFNPNADLILITESGYLMLVKSFSDDLAWTVQRELVNFYFRGKSPAPEQPALETGERNLSKAEKSKRALAIKEMNAKVRLSNQFLKLAKIETLSTECKNILLAKAAEVLSGTELTPQPNFDQKTYSAAEVGKMFGVTAQKIGRISNEHNMKTSEYGAWYRSKSEYSDREVDTFRYNDKAIEQFRTILLLRDMMG